MNLQLARLWLALIVFAATAAFASSVVAQESRTATEVQETVAEVLADPEYRHLFSEPEEKAEKGNDELPQWLRDFLKWLFGSDDDAERETGGLPSFDGQILFYVAMTILVAVLAGLLMSLIVRRTESVPVETFLISADEQAIQPTHPPGDIPTNEYERRALAAAQAGDFRTALRELVLGAMSWTERADFIRYRRGLTNRDYVRAIWSQTTERDSMLRIVAEFELVFYGHRPAEASAYEACLTEFRKSFSGEAADATLAS